MAHHRAAVLTTLIFGTSMALLPATTARAASVTATATASVTVLAPPPQQPASAAGPLSATDPAGRTVSTSRTLTAGTLRVTVNYN